MRVIICKEDCYCSLSTFYENMAKKMGFTVDNDTMFDCRKICVTKTVQDELRAYYYEEECLTNFQISALFLNAGPKANVESPEQYIVEVENGFVTKQEDS